MRQQASREYTIIDMARAFGIASHTAVEQKRKYTGEDYHHHSEEVLQILLTYSDPSPEEQVAALLHDVIEDTGVTRDVITQIFGMEVAQLVVELTDVSKPTDGNRKVRKAIDCEHTSKASLAAKRIKCADLISNTKSIVKHDHRFAKVYLDEKFNILNNLILTMNDELIFKQALITLAKSYRIIYPNIDERVENYRRLMNGE